jgi:hypothetical protein
VSVCVSLSTVCGKVPEVERDPEGFELQSAVCGENLMTAVLWGMYPFSCTNGHAMLSKLNVLIPFESHC